MHIKHSSKNVSFQECSYKIRVGQNSKKREISMSQRDLVKLSWKKNGEYLKRLKRKEKKKLV